MALGSLVLKGARLRLVREVDGRLNVQRLMAAADNAAADKTTPTASGPAASAPAATATSAASPSAPGWQVVLGKLQIEDA